MKLKKRAATMAGLEAVGYKPAPCSSSKYILFGRPDVAHHYLVGKSGALRRKQCDDPISSSSSLTDLRYHRALQVVGQSHLCYTTIEQAQAHLMEALR